MNKKGRKRERERGGEKPPCDTPPVLLPTNSQFRSENSEQTLHVKLSKTIGIKKRDDIRKKRMKRPFFAEVSEMLQERLGQKLTISFACLIWYKSLNRKNRNTRLGTGFFFLHSGS